MNAERRLQRLEVLPWEQRGRRRLDFGLLTDEQLERLEAIAERVEGPDKDAAIAALPEADLLFVEAMAAISGGDA